MRCQDLNGQARARKARDSSGRSRTSGCRGTSERIRGLRIRAGRSHAQLAQALGINAAWYADLERDDEHLTSTLSLFQAMQLASVLGVQLHELFGAGHPEPRVALIDRPDLVVAHAHRERLTIEQLGQVLGWEMRDFIDSPIQAATVLPIRFLQDLSAALGINWLALVPDPDGI